MDLAKLIVEGFETKSIRAKLDSAKIAYKNEDKTIALLEKLHNLATSQDEFQQLIGLRTVQHIRSKAKGHAVGSEADQMAHDAIMEHQTFSNHFKYVCAKISLDLESIERLLFNE